MDTSDILEDIDEWDTDINSNNYKQIQRLKVGVKVYRKEIMTRTHIPSSQRLLTQSFQDSNYNSPMIINGAKRKILSGNPYKDNLDLENILEDDQDEMMLSNQKLPLVAGDGKQNVGTFDNLDNSIGDSADAETQDQKQRLRFDSIDSGVGEEDSHLFG